MNRRLLALLRTLVLAALVVPRHATASVDTAWVRRWDGSAHQDDWAEAMALDSQGNVYITGVTETDTFNGHYDIITLKYSPSGDLLWERQYGSPGAYLERPYSIAVDRNGNAYIGAIQSDLWTVLKYDSAGILRWVRHSGSGWCREVSVDSRGNLPACGRTVRTTPDFTTVEYLPNGDVAWARYYEEPDEYDFAWALAVSSQNEVCVAGQCTDSNPGGNYLVVKYDSAGGQKWVACYDGPRHGADWVSDIAVDRDGNVIVTGVSDNGYGTPFDYLTVKYNAEGETLWTRRYNGTANGQDEARAVAVLVDGAACVTGFSKGVEGVYEFATVCYSADGVATWTARFLGPGDGAKAYAVATDLQGCSYVTGSAAVVPGAFGDCMTVKYSSLGETLWTRSFSGPGNAVDAGKAIAVDGVGTVLVAGLSYNASGNSDILTIKYVQNGGVVDDHSVAQTPEPASSAEPNPFRSQTHLRFSFGDAVRPTLLVFDAAGRKVRTLDGDTDGDLVVWDGKDDNGLAVPAGVYTIVVETRYGLDQVKVVKLE
ncbi:MAG: SBBP repeat-containing protein [candidate division WOR-3 bacterium]